MRFNKILVIIQRSNGDVFFSSTLIESLFRKYGSPQIDLLVNDDTLPIAKLIPFVKNIYLFSYLKKKNNRWNQEIELIKKIYRKYDLSINLTASDRSVIYSLFASRESISAIEKNNSKSWWKKILLSHYYYFDSNNHILINNFQSLNYLEIDHNNVQNPLKISKDVILKVKNNLKNKGINKFIIFHPSAQYHYKIYPQNLRNKLLISLDSLGIPIIVTGSSNEIDSQIKEEIPKAKNIINLIGHTSLEEYFALSHLSEAYIGMDTVNMHIAASQSKPIFAIYGPTKLSMWAPWSNLLELSVKKDKPIQAYSNITLFQAEMDCVACGNAGCNNSGISDCLNNINPNQIFYEVKKWYQKFENK
jgi:heptosyltransferase III